MQGGIALLFAVFEKRANLVVKSAPGDKVAPN